MPQSNLEEKVNPGILKDGFSLRTDPLIFTSIAPTSIIRPAKRNQLSFSCTEINNLLSVPVHSVS